MYTGVVGTYLRLGTEISTILSVDRPTLKEREVDCGGLSRNVLVCLVGIHVDFVFVPTYP